MVQYRKVQCALIESVVESAGLSNVESASELFNRVIGL